MVESLTGLILTHSIFGPILVVFTSLSLIPQIIKVYKKKSSKDLSLIWLWYFLIMHGFWCIFNATREHALIYLINSITLGTFTAILLVLTYKYRNISKKILTIEQSQKKEVGI